MVARVFTGGWGAARGSESLGGSRGVVWTPPLSGSPALAASPEPGGGLAVGLVLRAGLGSPAPHRKTGGGG